MGARRRDVDISWHFYGGAYLLNALGTAVILWAGFTAARFITHDAFEGRPSSLTVLNIAHELVTLLVMGAHHRRLAAGRHRLSATRPATGQAAAATTAAIAEVKNAQPVDARAHRGGGVGAEAGLDGVLGVRHEADDVAALVRDAGDVAQRPVRVHADVAEGDEALALEAVERLGSERCSRRRRSSAG